MAANYGHRVVAMLFIFVRHAAASLAGVIFVCATILFTSAPAAAQKRFAYFSGGSLTGYVLEPTGSLTPIPALFPSRRGNPQEAAIHPSGKFLYVLTDLDTVSGFSIDQTSGVLSELPSSPYSYSFGGPATLKGIAVDTTGRFVFIAADAGTASNPTGPVSTFKVNQVSGELVPIDRQVQTNAAPVAFLSNPKVNDIYLFGNVNCSPTGAPCMAFRGYKVDPIDGTLTFPSSMGAPSNGNLARSMSVSPKRAYLFIGHGQPVGFIQSMAAPSINTVKNLGPRQFPISIAMDADEQFVYVVMNQAGPDNILRGYSIDPATKVLTELPLISPFGVDRPRVVTTDPLAPFLYVASSGGLRGYRIGTNGSLTPVDGSPFGFLPEKMVISRGLVQTITGPAPVLSKSSLQFGTLDIGAESPLQQIVLGNIGTQPVTNIAISLDNTLDFSQSNNCRATLLAEESCHINVVFKPVNEGVRSATLAVASNAGLPQTAALQGRGVGPELPSPIVTLDRTIVDFGGVVVNTTSPGIPIRVTNTGQAGLNVSSVSILGNPPEFTVQSDTCSGTPVPVGRSCTITPVFRPSAVGLRSATLRISDNAPGTHTVSLAGNGNTSPFTLEPPAGLPGATSVTVSAGQPAQYNLQVTPARDFLGPLEVALSCSGAPPGAICMIPSTVTTSNGNAVPITVNITTTARSGLAHRSYRPSKPFPNGLLAAVLTIATLWALFPVIAGIFGSKARQGWNYVALALAVTTFLLAGACGGGSASIAPPPPPAMGTPAGSFTVTVTATANTATQQLDLGLVVR